MIVRVCVDVCLMVEAVKEFHPLNQSGAAFWQYFGASLSHSVFAMCFLAFMFGEADRALSIWPRIANAR